MLAGWEWWAADPPGTLRRWAPGETLPAEVHDIWCRRSAAEPWRVQLMLDEHTASGDWVSRRNRELRRPISTIGARSETGVPYLVPEIQLFYKAKDPRPKDEADSTAISPLLSAAHRAFIGQLDACSFA